MLHAFSSSSGRPELLVTASADGRINLWDAVTSTLRQQLTRPAHLAARWTCVAWQPPRVAGGKGKQQQMAPGLLAFGTDTGQLVVWDVQRGEIVHELEAHSQRVLGVAFDGVGVLLSCGEDKQVSSWSVESGEQLGSFKAGKAAVHRLALSADGATCLLGGTTISLISQSSACAVSCVRA